MAIAVRAARSDDLDALATIEAAVFPGDRISRRSFRRLFASPSAALLVAGQGAEVEGYALALFRKTSARARLYSIAVRPHGAAGTGRLLLSAVEDAAARHGCEALGLEVRRDNARAIALYERNGYRRTGEIAGYYEDGETAFRFEKALPEMSSQAARRPANGGARTR